MLPVKHLAQRAQLLQTGADIRISAEGSEMGASSPPVTQLSLELEVACPKLGESHISSPLFLDAEPIFPRFSEG